MVGMLAQDRRGSQRLAPRSRQVPYGLLCDLLDEVASPGAPSVLGQVLPAGEGREVQGLGSGELKAVEGLSPVAGRVLLSAVEPGAGEILALDQRLGDVDSRPVLGTRDEPFLAAVREEVSQPCDLGRLFAADHDPLISPRPDLLPPAVEAADLAGEVGVHVRHETRELAGVVHVEQEVVVRREEQVATDADLIEALGPSEDADDDLVELRAGPKEVTAVEGAGGDLDQGTVVRDEAESSAHAPI